jgi:predicted dienelactone hydrolase
MRPLEILIPLLLVIHLFGRPARQSHIWYFTLTIFAVLLLHFVIEGWRWQMIPLYALTLVLTALPFLGIDIKPPASYLTLFLLALSTALPILLPVPVIPVPNGPFPIGTRIYELTDTSRAELYSGEEEARRFQVQVWYPSEAGSSSQRAPWMANADIFAPSISQDILNLPPFFLDHLALVKVPAYKDAAVNSSGEGFPVILFSHGWNGFNAQNTGQALHLASHGYAVVGVQHTYGAVITVFEDGMVAKNNPSALPDGAPNDEYEAAARKLADQWAGDLGFTLDFLEEQNGDVNSPFYGHLDLGSVGVYGHSTGGGAVIQFCGTDARCRALLGQDPFMRPVSQEVLEDGISQPTLFLFSQRWADDLNSRNNQLFDPFYERSSETHGALSIDGTAHYDFSDLPLLSPLAPQLGLKGPINGKRVTVILNDYLLSFFDMTLKGIKTDLFEKVSPYAEVIPKQ